MKTYDLYGTSEMTIDQLRDRIEQLLEVEFHEHDSSYVGVYYRAGDLRGENFVLQANGPEEDPDELPEPEFAEQSVILEVNASERPEALRKVLSAVPGLILLRTEHL